MLGKTQKTTLDANVVLNFKGRICVPRVDLLTEKLLAEYHGSRYSIHPGVTEMSLLFVGYQESHYRICVEMSKLSTSEARTSKVCMFSSKNANSRLKVGNNSHVLCFWSSKTLRNFDSIWVVVDRFTKSAYIVLLRINYNA